ncbi:GDP-L-fucose synthase [Nitrosomonas eutropha]|uniref:NAD-dependent epimerase/dehydratase family protein n=1 Tax=Nitrosomonas eutropha TaxID=916 RepID=UPI00089622AF|nr:NAD-dependent epimerase/dehydratase family protein [Nitrosomonas eutropha]SDW10127.1 GDP-L-fucose synthase [Nitrosomonas eutropha]
MLRPIEIDPSSKIIVTGGTGLVGRALVNELNKQGLRNIISLGSRDCDLRNSCAVQELMERIRPDYVFHMAARVHGLGGNTRYKSDILVDNVLINTNVVEHARRSGVKKIVAMGSGCVYPELKGQEELYEEQVWSGPPHPSEDSYAHSKRLMLAQLDAARNQYGLSSAFVISGNLYGPYDNFNVEEGHVIPSLVAKFYDARLKGTTVKVWGSGTAIRDFTYAEDTAQALLAILRNLEGPVNMGSGQRHPIRDIVNVLHVLTGVPVEWDSTKSDGQLIRYYNLDRLSHTGFRANVNLDEGIRRTYDWYAGNWQTARC